MPKQTSRIALSAVLAILAFVIAGCTTSNAQATQANADSAETRQLPTPTPAPTPTPLPIMVRQESMRFEVFFEMSTEFMQLGSRSAPVLVGAWDGKSTTELNGSLSGQLGALESMIGEDNDLSLRYIKTRGQSCGYGPVAQATRDAFQNNDPEIMQHLMRGKLVDLISENYVCMSHNELAQITGRDKPVEPLALIGITSLFDPQFMAEAFYEVSEVSKAGKTQIRGVDVDIFTATVAIDEWMKLITEEGLDTNYGQMVSITENSAIVDLEFYVSEDKRIHRIRGIGAAVPRQNQGDVTEHGEGLVQGDISVLLGSQEVNLWLQVELYDHDGDIEIDIPADYIDAAPIFKELYESLDS